MTWLTVVPAAALVYIALALAVGRALRGRA